MKSATTFLMFQGQAHEAIEQYQQMVYRYRSYKGRIYGKFSAGSDGHPTIKGVKTNGE